MRSETAGFGDIRAAAAPRAGDGTVVRDALPVAGGSREFSAEAFTRLYEESHGRIYNLAARILNDRDQAADVTQDVFLATYKRLPELPQDVNMERWMYRVTVNACFDLLRRRHRRGEPVAHDVDDLPDHMDAYERADLTRAVESALSALSPRHRTALVLKDLHGFGNGEIAEIMGISRGSAGVLLLRARAAFRRAFGHAQPAGGKSVAGLGLGVLPMLPVPAALEAPAFLTGSAVATAALAPSAASLGALASSGAAPAVAGIGGSLGAVTAAKVALVAVGAFALVGGGIAAVTTQPGDDGRSAGVEVAGATVAGTPVNGNSHFAPREDLAAERLHRERAGAESDVEAGSGNGRNGAGGKDGRSATQSGSSSGPTLATGRRGEGSGSESGGSGSSGAAGTDGGAASAAGQSGTAGAAAGADYGGAAGDGSGSAGEGGSL